jgi:hypothetical protein
MEMTGPSRLSWLFSAGSTDTAESADPSATRARPGSSEPSVAPASLGAPGPRATAEGAGPWR